MEELRESCRDDKRSRTVKRIHTHTPTRSIGFVRWGGGGKKWCLISLRLKQEMNDVTHPSATCWWSTSSSYQRSETSQVSLSRDTTDCKTSIYCLTLLYLIMAVWWNIKTRLVIIFTYVWSILRRWGYAASSRRVINELWIVRDERKQLWPIWR
jgi:hypothetical protein